MEVVVEVKVEILLFQTGETFQLTLGSLMELFKPGTVIDSPLAYQMLQIKNVSLF